MTPESPTQEKRRLVRGLNASPGVAAGRIAFRPEVAVELAAQGEPVILVRTETSAEDIPGMRAAAGIVTTRGGLTGDAAIVARSLGKPCVAGCAGLHVDYKTETLVISVDDGVRGPVERVTLRAGDRIAIDGTTGWLSEA